MSIEFEAQFNDSQIDYIAKMCHDVNMKYCKSLGDYSQVPWEKAPEWQKESTIEGVKQELRSIGDNSPEQNHEHWMEFKLKQGWVYGEVKDPIKKTHPCLVPYDELPESQKFKDLLFKMTCLTALCTFMD